ncbi:translin-associated protein X [Rhipicephalus microplus]|uniref:translin-associated protein X n=1 Tax=Rhipicephalus microplus TaxID=6941 RepID=UPI003F6D01E1
MTVPKKPDNTGRNNGGRDRNRRFWRKGPRNGSRKAPEGLRDSGGDSGGDSQPSLEMFRAFRVEMDERNARCRRLLKLGYAVRRECRHIVNLLNLPVSADEREKVLEKVHRRLSELSDLELRGMAAELKGQDYYQYLRVLTVGLQGYVKAVSFFRYLKDDCLVTLDEINSALIFETQAEEPESERALRTDSTGEMSPAKSTEGGGYFSLEVTLIDYLHGVADMALELKRMSVSALGRGDRETPREMCRFLRDLYTGFISCNFLPCQSSWPSRDPGNRTWDLRQNVVEVEKACYAAMLHGPSGGGTQDAEVAAVLSLMEDLAVVDGEHLVEVEGEDLGEVEVENLVEA